MTKVWIFLAFVFISPLNYHTSAQQFFRIKTDYSVKFTDSKGISQTQIGVVYYDLNYNKVVMRNGYPVQEIVVQKDTSICHIRNNIIHLREQYYSPVELSIFHLALIGELQDYGLKKAGYKLNSVKQDKGLVIATWLPPDDAKSYTGKILISVKDKELFGIVFLDVNDKIIAKHFFRKYTVIDGFTFPTEILRISYIGDNEESTITNYNKIILNEPNEEEFYNYKIPE